MNKSLKERVEKVRESTLERREARRSLLSQNSQLRVQNNRFKERIKSYNKEIKSHKKEIKKLNEEINKLKNINQNFKNQKLPEPTTSTNIEEILNIVDHELNMNRDKLKQFEITIIMKNIRKKINND